MSKSFQPLLEMLFRAEQPSGKRLKFSWRLVRWQGRPQLLLPEDSLAPRLGLELYSAQRPRAKLWRGALPKLLRSPAAVLFQQVTFQPDTGSEFVRFLSEQSGVPVEQLRAPAIKFGGVGERKMRLALLVCDQTERPAKVIKVGLNPAGRAATDREADMLAQLPADVLGCIRMSGRLAAENLSAFATPFFPGDSPKDDAGLEILFHSWLNAGAAGPVVKLDSWRELEAAAGPDEPEKMQALRAALAGREIRSTLYHGDFAPWNLRAINALNLRAYDWESGFLRGIPGWDWFHFIVLTSILIRGHSSERVAAELDQLIQSPRFQKYAQAAGIEKIVEPLLLAYLLHEKHVVRPVKGREVGSQLIELLWTHWQLEKKPAATANAAVDISPPAAPLPVVRQNGARTQVKSAFTNLANLFWEPTLSTEPRPPFPAQLRKHWKAVLASLAWILGVANLHLLTNPHLMFQPFYLMPCIFMALKTDRRLATVVAQFGAIAGPLLFYYARPDFVAFDVICWNTAMRMVMFQLVVILFDRIGRQSALRRPQNPASSQMPSQTLAGNWPVILLTLFFFALVIVFDVLTGPQVLLTPFYMVPCIILTLAMNWRWGTVAALLAAFFGSFFQRDDPGFQPLDIEFWNTLMRLAINMTVVVLLERVRRENILYSKNGSH